MNKRLTFIILAVLVAILAILALFQTKPWRKATPRAPTPTPTPVYAATFTLQADQTTTAVGQSIPVRLAFTIDEDPSERGIIGIKATLYAKLANVFTLSATEIKGMLPPPWQYLRKEVTENGEIIIEAIYLKLEDTGYLTNKSSQNFATINFLAKEPGTIELNFDQTKSEIRSKDNNWHIPITAKPESIQLTVP